MPSYLPRRTVPLLLANWTSLARLRWASLRIFLFSMPAHFRTLRTSDDSPSSWQQVRSLMLRRFRPIPCISFKDLFRKCFGGGRAELVLEEGVDILEAGIDIVARPPGKKLRTLMQMSGGEKTMTTIALLLAIFKSKASPFCILDEVDAPLDDANVRRFTVLLDDFLANTQFIIITHNKVTMGEADTLYGITMQERGVSKRVAVSLESYDPEKMEEMAASSSA